MGQKNSYVILALIIILGAFLRFYGLGSEDLGLSESITARVIELEPRGIVRDRLHCGHGPLYCLMMHYWGVLFGESEFSLRFPSPFFGVASIYLLFLIGKSLFNSKTGLMAAFILAISWINIWYSREARANSLVIFFDLLSIFLLLRRLDSKKKRIWIGYICATALALHLHNSALLVVVFEVLFVAFMSRKYKDYLIKFLPQVIIALLIYLPVAIGFAQHAESIKMGMAWISPVEWETFKRILVMLGPQPHTVFHNKFAYARLFFLFFLLILGVVICFRKNNKNKMLNPIESDAGVLLLLWLFIPTLTLSILSYLTYPMLISLYVLISSCAFYIFIASAVSNIKNKTLRVLLPIMLFIIIYQPLCNYTRAFSKPQWRDAFGYVRENAKDDELLLIVSVKWRPIVQYYWKDNKVIGFLDELTLTKISETVMESRKVWIIVRQESSNDIETIKDGMRNKFELSIEKQYRGIKILYFTDKHKGTILKRDVNQTQA